MYTLHDATIPPGATLCCKAFRRVLQEEKESESWNLSGHKRIERSRSFSLPSLSLLSLQLFYPPFPFPSFLVSRCLSDMTQEKPLKSLKAHVQNESMTERLLNFELGNETPWCTS